MRSVLIKRISALGRLRSDCVPFTATAHPEPCLSHGFHCALAGKGVIVNEKAFYLDSSDLQQKGTTIAESSLGLAVHARGNILGQTPEISKAQFSTLLKQVTNHLSFVSDVYVHDGAIGSTPKCDAKVRIISDSLSALPPLSNYLWKTSARAVSHDSSPIIVYVASTISESITSSVGVGAKEHRGLIAADIDRSALILCGDAFADANAVKGALSALSGPCIAARGGIPLSARFLESGDSTVLLFVPEDFVGSCSYRLVCPDEGVILTSQGVAPLFQTGRGNGQQLYQFPSAVILVTSDSTGTIPSVSKLSHGQTAYHFLAGYNNGRFVPAYGRAPLSIDPLELSKALLTVLKDRMIPSYLVNSREEQKHATVADIIKLVESNGLNNAPAFRSKGGYLEQKYRTFLSSKYKNMPEEYEF